MNFIGRKINTFSIKWYPFQWFFSKDRRAPIFSFGWWTCFYCLTFCKFSKFLANQSFLCSGYDVFLQRKEREKSAHVMDSEWLKAKRTIANIILIVWPFKHAHNLYHLWTVFRPRFHYTPDIFVARNKAVIAVQVWLPMPRVKWLWKFVRWWHYEV